MTILCLDRLTMNNKKDQFMSMPIQINQTFKLHLVNLNKNRKGSFDAQKKQLNFITNINQMTFMKMNIGFFFIDLRLTLKNNLVQKLDELFLITFYSTNSIKVKFSNICDVNNDIGVQFSIEIQIKMQLHDHESEFYCFIYNTTLQQCENQHS